MSSNPNPGEIPTGDAPVPAAIVLVGRRGRLRPLDAERDASRLYPLSHDEHMHATWVDMKVGPFGTEQAFTEHVVALVADPKRAFLTVDGPDGKALGWLCLMEAKPAHRVVELGYVLYTPPLQRTGLAAHRLAAEPRARPRADETRRPSVLCGGSAVEKVPRLNRRSLRVADAGC